MQKGGERIWGADDSWTDLLGEHLRGETSRVSFLTGQQRYLLLARARWSFFCFLAVYGLGAAAGYTYSDYSWFLSSTQMVLLLCGLAAIIAYNAYFTFGYRQLASLPWTIHLQILIDFLWVSVLVHFSGGAASWFWPVYMLVTFEATILLEERRKVLFYGLLGGLFYGVILGGEYLSILPNITMPFIDPELHHQGFYLVLMWFWVSVLNVVAALVGATLMAVVRREHARVQATENRLMEFLDQANDLIFSLTPEGRFVYANRAWLRVMRYPQEAVPSLSIMDIIDNELKAKCLTGLRKAMNGEEVELLEGQFITRDGDKVNVEGTLTCSFDKREVSAIWVICRDITARVKAQTQLYHMAHHDQLTGLPNRLFFGDRLRQAIALAKRQQQLCAILFLDLDRFKIINDTLGHAVGDELLKEVAIRLTNCVREVDTVARLGGDEFAIALGNLHSVADAEQVAGKILKELARPAVISEQELFITTSIGISLYPTHTDEADLLVKKADVAMYQAKSQGRNNYQVYDEAMDIDAERRMLLESGMRKALERDEFRIYYQPKIDSVSGGITALEALIRWEHPEMGMLSPADFIALAEETGLIMPIGEWVMRRACEDNRRWQEEGLPKIRVAVNLSGFQLQQKNLVETVKTILRETRLDGEYLEFEITETVIMQNPEFAVNILTQLRGLGIHISIDDFGTGYSSLAHLKRFSVNTLKIDKTFVRDIEVNETDEAITSAIISMGNSLNLKVIAEGVETEGQFMLLKEKHCDEMQGYLFSRPVPSEDVVALLRKGENLRSAEKPT